MVAAQEHFPKLTPALEWEEQQELRYEYTHILHQNIVTSVLVDSE
jgi:hypothetical protein